MKKFYYYNFYNIDNRNVSSMLGNKRCRNGENYHRILSFQSSYDTQNLITVEKMSHISLTFCFVLMILSRHLHVANARLPLRRWFCYNSVSKKTDNMFQRLMLFHQVQENRFSRRKQPLDYSMAAVPNTAKQGAVDIYATTTTRVVQTTHRRHNKPCRTKLL